MTRHWLLAFVAALLCFATGARAQGEVPAPPPPEAPSDEWGDFPGEKPPPPPPSEEPPSAPPPPLEAESQVVQPPPPPRPDLKNRVSLYSATPLGTWKRALALHLGFPLVGVRAAIGITESMDVGLGLDSFYGVMNEPRLVARYNLVEDRNWSVGVSTEVGQAFFNRGACNEGNGARWLTGRRNFNVAAGLVASFRGTSQRAARLFADLRYHLAVDTEPCQTTPLGGMPPAVQVGHNFPLRVGAEMPFSSKTSFLFLVGFDIHGRAEDSVFMPSCSVGLVTQI
jgi:hypothetical protein